MSTVKAQRYDLLHRAHAAVIQRLEGLAMKDALLAALTDHLKQIENICAVLKSDKDLRANSVVVEELATAIKVARDLVPQL